MATKVPTKALTVQTLTPGELSDLLKQSGMVARGGDFNRLAFAEGVFTAGDDMFVYNPGKPTIPAFLARIVAPPVYYSAVFLSADESNGGFDPDRIGRPDLRGTFAKKYDNPEEDPFPNAGTEAFDQIKDKMAEIGTRKPAFKADIQLQIIPESGELQGDEPIYTLTLSTTGVIEWRGSSRNRNGGSVSDKNFMYQLAELAATQAAEAGGDATAQQTAVMNALLALRLGNVVAEVRNLIGRNDDGSRTWPVISFTPIFIGDSEAAPALTAGTDDDAGF